MGGDRIVNGDHEIGNVTGNEVGTERALRASELSSRRLFEAAQDGILILDVDTGRINDVNPFLFKLLGFSRDEMVGRTVGELSPFKDIVSNQAMLERLQDDGYVRYHDLPLETRDGRKIAVEFVSNVYQAGDKKVIQCNVRDITERKLAEDKMRQLFQAVDQSPVSVVFTDTSGNIEYVNRKFTALTGYSSAEVVGKNPRILKSGECPPATYRELWARITSGGTWSGEFHNRKKNGELFWEWVVISPVLDATGKPTHFLAIKEDITERKRTEEALRQSEEQLRAMFDLASVGIAQADPRTGRWLRVNRKMCEITGYSAGELLQLHVPDITHPEDRQSDWEAFERVMRGESPDYRMEKRYIRKDGTPVWVNVNVAVIRDAAGQPTRTVAAIEDITERRKLEAQFIEAQKMNVVGQLAAGVAHDFNNILAVIMGYNNLIQADLEPDSPLRKYTKEIQHSSDRAMGLTRQLLIFSRKEKVQPVVLDLNDAVKDLDKMLRRLLDEQIELAIVPGKQTGRIKADPGYIGQVLMNLAVNARDAMPNGGKLTIATQNVTLDGNHTSTRKGVIPGDHVMMSVSDTGTGMTDEVKARIFEAFFTTKPAGKGTGLGLTTCQTIVQQSGGHIDVDSAIGKGTTFKVYFPLVNEPLGADTEIIKAGPPPRGTETLLVVEDEPGLRHLTQRALEAQGYAVLLAANGKDALLVARTHKGAPIRLVVTDVIMPLMDGKVMAESLKSTYPDLKILFTSGSTDEAMAQHGVIIETRILG